MLNVVIGMLFVVVLVLISKLVRAISIRVYTRIDTKLDGIATGKRTVWVRILELVAGKHIANKRRRNIASRIGIQDNFMQRERAINNMSSTDKKTYKQYDNIASKLAGLELYGIDAVHLITGEVYIPVFSVEEHIATYPDSYIGQKMVNGKALTKNTIKQATDVCTWELRDSDGSNSGSRPSVGATSKKRTYSNQNRNPDGYDENTDEPYWFI